MAATRRGCSKIANILKSLILLYLSGGIVKDSQDPKKYSTLMGTKVCPKCGKDVWVRGYIETHDKSDT